MRQPIWSRKPNPRAFGAEAKFQWRGGGIRPWLLATLHNVFHTRIGKRNRERTLAEDLQHERSADRQDQTGTAWDLDSLDWDQVGDRFKQAIARLPVHYREVLLCGPLNSSSTDRSPRCSTSCQAP